MPELEAHPVYPDLLRRPRGLVAYPALAWQPRTAPDVPMSPTLMLRQVPGPIPLRTSRAALGAFTIPAQLFPTVVPTFGWPPRLPPPLLKFRVQVPTQYVTSLINTVPYPDVRWQGRWPDRLIQSNTTAWQRAAMWDVGDPIPNPPSPALAWAPKYSVSLPRVVAIQAAQHVAWLLAQIMPPAPSFSWQGISPSQLTLAVLAQSRPQLTTWRFPIIVPDILANLTYDPTFPDLLRRPAEPRPEATRTSGGLITTAAAPTSWRPFHANFLRLRVTTPTTGTQTFQTSGIITIGLRAWRATYPDRLTLRRSTQGYTGWNSQPLPQPPQPVCVVLADEQLSPLQVQAEMAQRPTVAGERLLTSPVTEEGIC